MGSGEGDRGIGSGLEVGVGILEGVEGVEIVGTEMKKVEKGDIIACIGNVFDHF